MKVGDVVWFLDSNIKRQAVIKKITRSDAIIKFVDKENSGIRISVNRLFESEEAIDIFIKKKYRGQNNMKKNQYDYM